jgi:hypothetical protein
MDIALLKLMLMKHSHTPEILILKIGEWVLAVGNPYNVNGHCWYRFGKSKRPWHKRIQSFIQTDAAVNPGNRAAQVNTDLIGTTDFLYDRFLCWVFFAVPSNIARKSLKTLWSTATCNEQY